MNSKGLYGMSGCRNEQDGVAEAKGNGLRMTGGKKKSHGKDGACQWSNECLPSVMWKSHCTPDSLISTMSAKQSEKVWSAACSEQQRASSDEARITMQHLIEKVLWTPWMLPNANKITLKPCVIQVSDVCLLASLSPHPSVYWSVCLFIKRCRLFLHKDSYSVIWMGFSFLLIHCLYKASVHCC